MDPPPERNKDAARAAGDVDKVTDHHEERQEMDPAVAAASVAALKQEHDSRTAGEREQYDACSKHDIQALVDHLLCFHTIGKA